MQNWKRTFLEMYTFNCIKLTVVYPENNKSDGKKKNIIVISKGWLEDDVKTGFRCFAVNGRYMHKRSQMYFIYYI